MRLLDTDVMATLAGQLVQYGVLGICVIAFAYTITVLWKEYSRVQQARIDDAKSYATQSLDAMKAVTGALVASTTATESNTEALRELRDAIRRAE